MLDNSEIIKGCRMHKKNAQQSLYLKYNGVLMGICVRYAPTIEEAEDLLQESFIKIFSKFRKYDKKGSLEGWIKRITVNLAINYYHKHTKLKHKVLEENFDENMLTEDVSNEEETPKSIILNTDFRKEDLLEAMEKLPNGYKMVFNLYVLEKFSHQKIADTLHISINTSKSQLSRARKQLQDILYEKCLSMKGLNYE